MAKTAAFGVIHLGISFSVGYLLTGSVAIAGTVMLVEPVANMVAHYFFDRWWERRRAGRIKLRRFVSRLVPRAQGAASPGI
jgi:uncharacterized membrane protein